MKANVRQHCCDCLLVCCVHHIQLAYIRACLLQCKLPAGGNPCCCTDKSYAEMCLLSTWDVGDENLGNCTPVTPDLTPECLHTVHARTRAPDLKSNSCTPTTVMSQSAFCSKNVLVF